MSMVGVYEDLNLQRSLPIVDVLQVQPTLMAHSAMQTTFMSALKSSFVQLPIQVVMLPLKMLLIMQM